MLRDWSKNVFRYAAVLVPATVALGIVLPFLYFGIPSGHDFEFHLNSWIEVIDHWKQGVLYPHWAAWAHYGYGEARFIFYPPVSWTLGAALGLILPWKIVPAAYQWLALALSGFSMFFLARRWLSRRDAILASALYVANPYHLVIVYWRSALAELLAAAYLPLLLYFVLRSDEDGTAVIAPLSLIMAAGWLTNIPSAVMMNYSLALLLCAYALFKRSSRMLAAGALAVILGLALAAVYLVPVFHQQSWVNLVQVLAPGVRPQESFLFTMTTDADHNRFNIIVSVVAVVEMALVGLLLFSSRRLRNNPLWLMLCIWSVLCSLLMFGFSRPLWTYLPELRYVQFPWRWLLCLNVAFAILTVMALRRTWLRALVYAAALSSVLLVWRDVQPPWWDHAGDIQEMLDNQHDGPGEEGVDEYVPANIDPYNADQNAPRARFLGNAPADVQTPKWDAESRVIIADTRAPGEIAVRLFNFPSWKVRVNGKAVATSTSPATGQMGIPIAAGESVIKIKFVEGWDRWLGAGISLLAALICLVTHRRTNRLEPRSLNS